MALLPEHPDSSLQQADISDVQPISRLYGSQLVYWRGRPLKCSSNQDSVTVNTLLPVSIIAITAFPSTSIKVSGHCPLRFRCAAVDSASTVWLLAVKASSFPLNLVPSGSVGPCAQSFGICSTFPGMLLWGAVVLPRLRLPPAWLSWPQSWSPSASSAAPSRRSPSSVVEHEQCPLVTPPSPSAGLLGAERPGWCLHFPWSSGAVPSWGPFLPTPRRTDLGESGMKGRLGPGWWSWWPGLGGSGKLQHRLCWPLLSAVECRQQLRQWSLVTKRLTQQPQDVPRDGPCCWCLRKHLPTSLAIEVLQEELHRKPAFQIIGCYDALCFGDEVLHRTIPKSPLSVEPEVAAWSVTGSHRCQVLSSVWILSVDAKCDRLWWMDSRLKIDVSPFIGWEDST